MYPVVGQPFRSCWNYP